MSIPTPAEIEDALAAVELSIREQAMLASGADQDELTAFGDKIHAAKDYIAAGRLAALTVPREPTPEMIEAAVKLAAEVPYSGGAALWRAMYDAAPKAQQPPAPAQPEMRQTAGGEFGGGKWSELTAAQQPPAPLTIPPAIHGVWYGVGYVQPPLTVPSGDAPSDAEQMRLLKMSPTVTAHWAVTRIEQLLAENERLRHGR